MSIATEMTTKEEAVGKTATAMYIGEFPIEGTVVGIRRVFYGGKVELEIELTKEVSIMGTARPVGTIMPVYEHEITEIV